ncbi:MAG TPA: histidine kinase [Blastocatellia bacterium]|nr:histidine kinase [Blastocatellia bacterium]
MPEASGANKGWRKGWRDIRWMLIIAAVVGVILITLVPVYRQSPGRALASFIIAIVYGGSIGSVMTLFFNRYGERLATRRAPLNWLLLIAAIIALTAVGVLIAGLILVAVGVFEARDYWAKFRDDMRYSWVISILIGVSISLYERLRDKLEATTEELREKELAADRARQLATEARLSSLESRIHPHFLFNTLNSISSLIQEDPAQAEKLVERLAALLRFSLDSNQRRTVPLEREMKITRDYLEIERARFGERLRYSIDVPPSLGAAEVPPLAVQTLVENSVKHAIAPRREGGEVRITARAVGQHLRVEVADDGPGFARDALIAGHGLDTLHARLLALYDDRAALDITARDGRTVVGISLPVVEAGQASIV